MDKSGKRRMKEEEKEEQIKNKKQEKEYMFMRFAGPRPAELPKSGLQFDKKMICSRKKKGGPVVAKRPTVSKKKCSRNKDGYQLKKRCFAAGSRKKGVAIKKKTICSRTKKQALVCFCFIGKQSVKLF